MTDIIFSSEEVNFLVHNSQSKKYFSGAIGMHTFFDLFDLSFCNHNEVENLRNVSQNCVLYFGVTQVLLDFYVVICPVQYTTLSIISVTSLSTCFSVFLSVSFLLLVHLVILPCIPSYSIGCDCLF